MRHIASIVTLFLAFGACALAQSKPETPRTSDGQPKPAQQQGPSIGSEQSPAVVRVLPSPTADEEAAQIQASRHEEAKSRNANITLTFVIACFTGWLIRVGYLQRATTEATLATNKQISRAYIDLSHVEPGLRRDGDGGFLITLVMKNNGRTPGDVLTGRIWMSMTDKPGFQWVRLIEISKIPPAFINPNERLTIGDIKVKVTPEALAKTLTAWIAGEIYYRDRFGDVHVAGYGRRYFQALPANNLVFDESTEGMNYDRVVKNPEFDQFGSFSHRSRP